MLVILIDWRLEMRTIKFRAWNGSEFIKDRYNHNHFISIADGKLVQVQHDDVCAEGFVYGNPEPVVLQQFTGLTDVNGVEIYEGDIVSAMLVDKNGVKNKYVGNIFYQEYEFCIETEDHFWPVASWHCVCECEVIGNIYQNPELLK